MKIIHSLLYIFSGLASCRVSYTAELNSTRPYEALHLAKGNTSSESAEMATVSKLEDIGRDHVYGDNMWPTHTWCECAFHVALFDCQIRGTNWDRQKVGETGIGLYDNIRGCSTGGTVTDWGFSNTKDWPGFMQEWEFGASGYLPLQVGMPACVGRAVLAVGGKTADRCI